MQMTKEKEIDFAVDALKRQHVADRLAKLVHVLAQSEVLPAGRVIAVDSPWGSGKTWVAERLPAYFAADKAIGRCIYVDAFQFDFHADPFAVLASAILTSCEGPAEFKREFRKAAGAVLKASLPAAGKALVKVGAKAIGVDVDVFADTLSEATGKITEKAIEKLLSSFEATTRSTDAFKARLEALAAASGGPFVIVIDELDRCRPDFALALLERVKHLFNVQGVVFVLFIHTPALHSAIQHTYGEGIDPAGYLKKFISVTLQLPLADNTERNRRDQTNFVRRFLNAQYPTMSNQSGRHEFMEALSIFSPVFDATFRDLQNAVLLSQLFEQPAQHYAQETAYWLLLRLRDPESYERLAVGDKVAYSAEQARLGRYNDRDHQTINQFRDMFAYYADPREYEARLATQGLAPPRSASIDECKEFMRYLMKVQPQLKVEHLQL